MSATPERTLANSEQRIADLERQLAEREAELAEALAQQTAAAEVLQVINSSPGDLAPVFDAMLEKAMRLCEAAFGQVFSFDGENFDLLAVVAPPEFTTAVRRWTAFRAPPGSPLERLAGGAEVVHIHDLATDPAFAP